MADYKISFKEHLGVSDSLSGTYRKLVEQGTEDIVIARFWVQPFRILEKTTFDEERRKKIQNVLY